MIKNEKILFMKLVSYYTSYITYYSTMIIPFLLLVIIIPLILYALFITTTKYKDRSIFIKSIIKNNQSDKNLIRVIIYDYNEICYELTYDYNNHCYDDVVTKIKINDHVQVSGYGLNAAYLGLNYQINHIIVL